MPLRPIPYEDSFSPAEWEQLSKGLIPEVMEDKWFVFAEGDTLFLHRSWGGEFAYRVVTSSVAGEVRVARAEREDWGDVQEEDDRYHSRLLRFLLRGLVLRQDVRFPLPAGHGFDDGLFQFHVAGTSFTEERESLKVESFWKQFARRLGLS